ncbi:MAG: ATP-binding cassette domain-containing protein [Desulfobacterales bacterium]|nr:ATP-binding cassette domain-containing protein [Desulfobacterales bacterium]MCP4160596.1 ATP-binding cassette domain-containing protein [Deltaproteobacteria bacterium]
MKTIIDLQRIEYRYPGNEEYTLKDLDLKLTENEKIGMIASNGSGKTTLFHIIMGLTKPSSGTIEIFGKDMIDEKDFIDVRKKIGLLFQDADDQLFCPTVIEDVAFGPLNQGKTKDDALEIASDTLSFLGIESFKDRINFKLSGGEKRLVSLATVLAMKPEAILLDEPTTGLDEKTKDKLIEVLAKLDLPSIIISHDAEFVNKVTSKIYTIKEGKVLTDKDIYLHSHVHAHPHDSDHKHEHTGTVHSHGHPHGRDEI